MRTAYPAMRVQRHVAGIAFALVTHLLLAWFVLTTASQPTRDRHPETVHLLPEVQWLLPRPVTRVVATAPAAVSTPRQRAGAGLAAPATPRPRRHAAPAAAAAAAAITVPAPADSTAPPAAATPDTPPSQDETPRAPIDAARLVRDLHLTNLASGLDSKRGKGETASPLTLEDKLAAGFERARQAADTHWLKSGGMQEITPANSGGTRIYRMRSLLGTFCVYVRDDGKPPVSGNCPR